MNLKSAIKDMFTMKRGTYEHVPLSQEYEEAKDKMYDAVDAFLDKLTPEQQDLFHETYGYISDKGAAYAEDHFVEGFKFGLLVGIEVGKSNS